MTESDVSNVVAAGGIGIYFAHQQLVSRLLVSMGIGRARTSNRRAL
jgi:hypothetical protein